VRPTALVARLCPPVRWRQIRVELGKKLVRLVENTPTGRGPAGAIRWSESPRGPRPRPGANRRAGHRLNLFAAEEPIHVEEDQQIFFQPHQFGHVLVSRAGLRMPGMSGLELQEELARRKSHLPMIILTAYARTSVTVRAIQGGAVTLIDKPYHDDDLWDAIRDAIERDRAIRKQKMYRLDFQHRLESPDGRERTALDLILAGNPNKAIERRLGLSRRTVERVRSSILAKTSFLSFVELSVAYGEARAAEA